MLEQTLDNLDHGLIGLFAHRSGFITQIMQDTLHSRNLPTLVIDINHRWTSTALPASGRVIQPDSRRAVLNSLQQLHDYVHPHLSLIFVDDLPLYFRDYYGRDTLQTQNMRAYGASLSLLHRVSRRLPVIFATYANGMVPSEPILFHHSKYYCDQIIRYVEDPDGGIVAIPIHQK